MVEEQQVSSIAPPHRRRGCMLPVTIVVVLIGGLTYRQWLPAMYRYLDVSTSPMLADYVVVLAGGANSNRLNTAINLYKQGYSQRLILSSNRGSLQQDLDLIQKSEIASTVVDIVSGTSSTWEEAHSVLEILRDSEASSAIIVTDAYHTRRTQATYQYLAENDDLTLTFVAASATLFQANDWWLQDLSYIVWSEYVKIVYYLFAYGVSSF